MKQVVESGSEEEDISGSRKRKVLAKGKGKQTSRVTSDVDLTLVETNVDDTYLNVRKAYNQKFYTNDS